LFSVIFFGIDCINEFFTLYFLCFEFFFFFPKKIFSFQQNKFFMKKIKKKTLFSFLKMESHPFLFQRKSKNYCIKQKYQFDKYRKFLSPRDYPKYKIGEFQETLYSEN